MWQWVCMLDNSCLIICWFLFFSHTIPTILSAHDHRKKKAVHKTTTTDDKRLQSTLKRIGVNAIPAIEEVNIFKDDVVIQFINPKGDAKLTVCGSSNFFPHNFHLLAILIIVWFLFCFSVQASIAANTWVVSGSPQTKSMFLCLFFLYLKIYVIDNLFLCVFEF